MNLSMLTVPSKKYTGNGEAKGLICTNHRHELRRGGIAGGKRGNGQSWGKGEKL